MDNGRAEAETAGKGARCAVCSVIQALGLFEVEEVEEVEDGGNGNGNGNGNGSAFAGAGPVAVPPPPLFLFQAWENCYTRDVQYNSVDTDIDPSQQRRLWWLMPSTLAYQQARLLLGPFGCIKGCPFEEGGELLFDGHPSDEMAAATLFPQYLPSSLLTPINTFSTSRSVKCLLRCFPDTFMGISCVAIFHVSIPHPRASMGNLHYGSVPMWSTHTFKANCYRRQYSNCFRMTEV